MKEEPIDSNKAYPYQVSININTLTVIRNTMYVYAESNFYALPQELSDQNSHLTSRRISSPYVHLRNVLGDKESVVEDPYPDLKQLLPVDTVTFAYQIADGMVSNSLW